MLRVTWAGGPDSSGPPAFFCGPNAQAHRTFVRISASRYASEIPGPRWCRGNGQGTSRGRPGMAVNAGEAAVTAGLAGRAGDIRAALDLPPRDETLPRWSRESGVRRLLLLTDVLALTLAFVIVEFWGGFDGGATSSIWGDLVLLMFAAPVWVLVAHGHNLYHADSRRADHGLSEELMPIVQMATLW